MNGVAHLGIDTDTREEEAIKQLLSGKTIMLKVRDPRMRVSTRCPEPLLTIAPIKAGKRRIQGFMFALQGGGCEIMKADNLKPSWLWKIGLTKRSAELLIEALQKGLVEKYRSAKYGKQVS